MSTQKNEQERDSEQVEGLQMHDQGPTYSSSFNESTPGEIEANRRESLENEEPTDEPNIAGAPR